MSSSANGTHLYSISCMFGLAPPVERHAHLPRPREHLRVLDRRLVLQRVGVERGVALDHLQRVAVVIAGAIEPGLFHVVGHVDDERLAVPAADRPSHPRRRRALLLAVHAHDAAGARELVGHQDRVGRLHDLEGIRHVGRARNAGHEALDLGIERHPVVAVGLLLRERLGQVRESRRLRRRRGPGGTLKAAPSADTGPWRASCAWRSQFAVLLACQMPLRFGRAVGRARRPVALRLAGGAGATRRAATAPASGHGADRRRHASAHQRPGPFGFCVGSRPSLGAPVPDDPMNSVRPSGKRDVAAVGPQAAVLRLEAGRPRSRCRS